MRLSRLSSLLLGLAALTAFAQAPAEAQLPFFYTPPDDATRGLRNSGTTTTYPVAVTPIEDKSYTSSVYDSAREQLQKTARSALASLSLREFRTARAYADLRVKLRPYLPTRYRKLQKDIRSDEVEKAKDVLAAALVRLYLRSGPEAPLIPEVLLPAGGLGADSGELEKRRQDRSFLEFSTSFVGAEGQAPLYAPGLSYSDLRLRSDFSYQRLLAGGRQGNALAARFDLTRHPARSVARADGFREAVRQYNVAVRNKKDIRTAAEGVEETYRQAAQNFERSATAPRAALLANYANLDGLGSTAGAGVGVSRLVPLGQGQSVPGLLFQGAVHVASGRPASGKDLTVVRTALGVAWQDRVPRADADAENWSWRWRVGVDLRPANALATETAYSFYIRHQSRDKRWDYTLSAGQGGGGDPFVGARVAYSLPFGARARQKGTRTAASPGGSSAAQ